MSHDRGHHPGCEHEGLYDKFEVQRTDGSDGPGGRHEGCRYLPLDLTHDPSARDVARLYAHDVAGSRPRFARELLALLDELDHVHGANTGGGWQGTGASNREAFR